MRDYISEIVETRKLLMSLDLNGLREALTSDIDGYPVEMTVENTIWVFNFNLTEGYSIDPDDLSSAETALVHDYATELYKRAYLT